jgi:hypothetical protein
MLAAITNFDALSTSVKLSTTLCRFLVTTRCRDNPISDASASGLGSAGEVHGAATQAMRAFLETRTQEAMEGAGQAE